MFDPTTTQCVMFEDLLDKSVHVQFNDECSSSDGGFANPELLDFLDAMDVEYVVAMGKNPVLKRFAELRLWASKTSCGRAQVSTRRIVLHLPASCPSASAWRRIACSLGAAYG